MSAYGAVTRPGARAAPRRGPLRAEPLLARRAARLAAFVPLAAFGALHWSMLVQPRAGGPMLLAVIVCALGGIALGAILALPRGARIAAATGIALVTAAAAIVVAGLPARLLLPGAWNELGGDVTQGVQALPDVRVPYLGVDQWPRIVILCGGALLVALAAAATFWPVRGRGSSGHTAGATALCVLYVVPAVDLTTTHQFLRGAAFAVLLAAFLWLERVPRTGVAGAGIGLAAAVALGLAAAPALDGPRPWVDYEKIAESFAPAASITFDFNHHYGPLDWPRDGREVLRVKAAREAYWKAENLDDFDGLRWRASTQLDRARIPLLSELPADFRRHRNWLQRIQVNVRSLTGHDVVGAGTIIGVDNPPSAALSTASPGTFEFESLLNRGDSYAADVYVPKPSPTQMAVAGTGYSGLADRYFTLRVPASRAGVRAGLPPEVIGALPELRQRGLTGRLHVLRRPDHARGRRAHAPIRLRAHVGAGPAPVRRPRRRRTSTCARVLAYLADGFALHREPAAGPPVPLESFLFDDHPGYCQQFSGAMALLLRMGGVPGARRRRASPRAATAGRSDYVVRDIDAHSWVEV